MKLRDLKQLALAVKDPKGRDMHLLMQESIQSLGLDPDNFYQELEMSEPFVETHRDISYSNAYVQLHSHTFYELLYCCNSSGTEYLVGSERYRLQRGDIVFVPPGISHRPLLPENMTAPYSRYVLWLSQDFLDVLAHLFSFSGTNQHEQAGLLRTAGTPWESLGDLFGAGVGESEQQEEGWQAAVIGNTIQLLTQIKRATDAHSVHTLKAEKPNLLDKLTAYIEENYHKPLTIDALVKQFFVSSSTVSHLFKDKLGVSIYRYMNQRRLIAAKSLIEKGILLEDVARQTGFRDYSGFYRAFRQEFGISPRQYKNLIEDTNKVYVAK